jgi:glyoxylase-like metal-dependent hydrolase (beta-lactamase superfamily II)
MGLRKLGDGFYLYPGSPSTGFRVIEGGVVLIDPGHGSGRHKDLLREARRLGLEVKAQLVTHGHADHVSVCPKIGAPLFIHRFEFSIDESPLVREVLTFGSKAPEGFLAYAFPGEVRVHGIFEWGDELFGLRAINLNGHSPGMTGFLDVENGVLYAGDSLFGERVVEGVGLPYFVDYGSFLDSLNSLEKFVADGFTVVPSHGPVVSGEEATRLIDLNRRRVTSALELALELLSKPLSVDELAFHLMKAFEVEPTPKRLALNLVPARAIVAELYNRGDIGALIENGLKWVRNQGISPSG